MAEGFAFQAQAWSNILVASSSGFSRLAAVLSKNTVVAPNLLSHPLHELDNVVDVYDKVFCSPFMYPCFYFLFNFIFVNFVLCRAFGIEIYQIQEINQ